MEVFKSYYSNGSRECEGFLKNGTVVGHWIFYHENGNIYSEGKYDSNGIPIEKWSIFYDNGQINYEIISPRGNLFGLCDEDLRILNFWTKDGIKLIVNGNGILTNYFANNCVEHISNWKNGLKSGILQEFYKSGNLKIERFYEKGMLNGDALTLHENGKLYLKLVYENGNSVGEYLEWYENGQMCEYGNYENGEYKIKDFWNEQGVQLLIDGSGIKLAKYGTSDGDVYEENYVKGEFIGKKKITSAKYSKFIPKNG